VPAAINLADLYRSLGRETDGEPSLLCRRMRACITRSASISCGSSEPTRRSSNFCRAAELDPGQARYGYVYAVALHSAGRGSEAVTALKDNLARHPDDRDTLSALISFSRESGDIGSALEFAERLRNVVPDEPGLTGLIEDLRRQIPKPSAQ